MFKKSFSADFKAVGFNPEGLPTEFEGYAAVFDNVDLGGDLIRKGAFADTLVERYSPGGAGIPVYWNHELSDPFANVGATVEAKEDDHGLRLRATLDLETAWGKQTARLLKEGRVKQMSFSFDVVEGAWVEEEARSYYEIRKVDLFEASIVPIGLNQATSIVSVKAAHNKKTLPAPNMGDVDETSDPQTVGRRETAARRLRAMDL